MLTWMPSKQNLGDSPTFTPSSIIPIGELITFFLNRKRNERKGSSEILLIFSWMWCNPNLKNLEQKCLHNRNISVFLRPSFFGKKSLIPFLPRPIDERGILPEMGQDAINLIRTGFAPYSKNLQTTYDIFFLFKNLVYTHSNFWKLSTKISFSFFALIKKSYK